jgi:hypothetical protein
MVKAAVGKGRGMTRHLRRRIVVTACVAIVALATLAARRSALAQGAEGMGPRDVAVIPIESVPAWVSEGVARYVPTGESGEHQPGIEVLAVLRDPRDVPIDRFLYALSEQGEVIVHPEAEAIRRSLASRGHSAVAVYVRATVRADLEPDVYIDDPFFVGAVGSSGTWTYEAWRSLSVAYEAEGVSSLPCLEPMTIGERARPFVAPDTGARIRPDEYLPPMPHYAVRDTAGEPGLLAGQMVAGETREGWVLCLAPNVPVEEVRIGTNAYGQPFWAPVEEMPIGAWYLLEDREVLGWNEDPTRMRGDESVHVDEQVVYRGDVWVSMAQAFRYIYTSRADRNGTLVEPYEEQIRVQMHFAGMEELLQVWDQLALKDALDVAIIYDIQAPWARPRAETIELRGRGSSLGYPSGWISNWRGEDDQLPQSPRVWIYPGDLSELRGIGAIQVWQVDFHEVDARELSTEEICAVTECATIQVEVAFEEYVERSLPLIPAGTRAFGLTVRSARFIRSPVLYAGGLDVFLEEGSNRVFPGEWQFVVVQTEAEGGSLDVGVGNLEGGSGVVGPGSAWLGGGWRYDFGTAGGLAALGGDWLPYVRAAHTRTVFLGEVPSDWQLADLVLMRDRGPVWELP